MIEDKKLVLTPEEKEFIEQTISPPYYDGYEDDLKIILKMDIEKDAKS